MFRERAFWRYRITVAVLPVELDCRRQAFSQLRCGAPPEYALAPAGVGVVASDIDALALLRKGTKYDLEVWVQVLQQLCNVQQGHRIRGPDIKRAFGWIHRRARQQKGLDHIVNVNGIAQLAAIAKQLDRPTR